MNFEQAIKILGLDNYPEISKDLIRKRFRQIALLVHPDKFRKPKEILVATRKFRSVNQARVYLSDYLGDRSSINNPYSETSQTRTNLDDETAESESTTIEEPEYLNDESALSSIFNLLYLLLLPGGLLVLFIIYIISEIKDPHGLLNESGIGAYIVVGFCFLPVFIFVVYAMLAGVLEQNIFLTIAFIQVIATGALHLGYLLQAKSLQKKVKSELIKYKPEVK